jgi:hypothetical protein
MMPVLARRHAVAAQKGKEEKDKFERCKKLATFLF